MGDSFFIDRQSSRRRLARAAAALATGAGIVWVEELLALRRQGPVLLCEVIDPAPLSHRCEMEYDVLLENARLALQASGLMSLLPEFPRKWLVVAGREKRQLEVTRS